MGNKQDELEAILQQANCDLVAVTETQWDCSYDWSAAMDGYKLFKRDRQRRESDGMTVCVSDLMLLSLRLEIRSSLYG